MFAAFGAVLRVRAILVDAPTPDASLHDFSRPGVSRTSPSTSSSPSSWLVMDTPRPRRFEAGVPPSTRLRGPTSGGDGVARGADDAGVVGDETEGALRAIVRPGVENELREPREMFGWVPLDWREESTAAAALSAADMADVDEPRATYATVFARAVYVFVVVVVADVGEDVARGRGRGPSR